MTFREWLRLQEGGPGSGTQFSATGAGAGGQAQAGMGMKKPASPQKTPPSPFSPSDSVPKGFKPSPGAGGSVGIWKPSQPGLSGAGVIPKKAAPTKITGGSLGGGYPGGKMKAKMKKK